MRLLPAFPRGVGTRHVESLGSFLLRAAMDHGMSIDQFLRALILSHADSVKSENNLKRKALEGKRIVTYKTTRSSPSRESRSIIALLESAYNSQIFETLGLFRLYPIFTRFHGCFSDLYRWCPACWLDDIEVGLPPYFRASWNIEGLLGCPEHNIHLHDHCYGCRSKYSLAYRENLVKCRKCGNDLSKQYCDGTEGWEWYKEPTDLIELIEVIQSTDDWNPSSGYLRSIPDILRPSLAIFPQPIRDFMRQNPDPMDGNLTYVRDICKRSNLSLWQVIGGQCIQSSLVLDPDPMYEEGCFSRHRTGVNANPSRDEMLRELKRLLHKNSNSPQPVKFYADQIGVSADCLAYRYPRLYRRMVDFYELYVRGERLKLQMKVDMVLELLRSQDQLDRGVKKICHELMSEWGFPKNLSREHIKAFRDELLSDTSKP